MQLPGTCHATSFPTELPQQNYFLRILHRIMHTSKHMGYYRRLLTRYVKNHRRSHQFPNVYPIRSPVSWSTKNASNIRAIKYLSNEK